MCDSEQMRPVDLIRKKRDGGELSADEIRALIAGYTSDEIPDYQMSAWLMAVVLRGMNDAEIAALTDAMLRSGEVLDLSDLPGRKVDKHSTGGVGDKTSLLLAPMAAAAGLFVPMISGRGLGHTGGTLDKLEAIPGFRTDLSLARFREVLRECRAAMIGQTEEIAPADKRIYALRDVTGTVESSALICASIMSKKLAEGIDALVLDVKTGSGAFMKELRDSEHLARLMVETGKRIGKRMVALITDMDQPLGSHVGNALEVKECLALLRGERPSLSEDLRALTLELAAWMFLTGDRVRSIDEGRKLGEEMIGSGAALANFRQMVEMHGGDPRAIDDPALLPKAVKTLDAEAPRSGYVTRIACEQAGIAASLLGGGRSRKDDVIDPGVGLILHVKVAERVEAGQPLCTVHYNADARLKEATDMLQGSFVIDAKPPAARALIQGIIQ